MDQFIGSNEVPIGFGMALAENLEAMEYFSSLDSARQHQIINQSRQIHSKRDMHQFVNSHFIG